MRKADWCLRRKIFRVTWDILKILFLGVERVSTKKSKGYKRVNLRVFYEKKVMTEPELPPLDQVGKKRTFTLITTTANNLIKKVKSVGDEEKLAILVDGLHAATREYISIMLEKLELTEIISHSPKGKFLYELDLKKLFTQEDKELEQVTVSFG